MEKTTNVKYISRVRCASGQRALYICHVGQLIALGVFISIFGTLSNGTNNIFISVPLFIASHLQYRNAPEIYPLATSTPIKNACYAL